MAFFSRMKKEKPLADINKLIEGEMRKAKKWSVAELEQQARNVYETGRLTAMQKEFYRGFLRAFEMLREHDLLKE